MMIESARDGKEKDVEQDFEPTFNDDISAYSAFEISFSEEGIPSCDAISDINYLLVTYRYPFRKS